MPANKKLLVLPGDGIGPEVMREVAPRDRLVGPPPRRHASTWRRTWSAAPRSTRAARRSPRRRVRARARRPTRCCSARSAARNGTRSAFDMRPESRILRLRKELGLFANLRPAMVLDPLVDATTLKPEVVQGPRPDDRARKHRRDLFRRAARHRDAAGRHASAASTPRSTPRRKSSASRASPSSWRASAQSACAASKRPT